MSDIEPLPPIPPRTPRPPLRLKGPLVFVLAGVLLLALCAGIESARMAAQPWSHALLAPLGKPAIDAAEAIAVQTRRVPAENYGSILPAIEENMPSSLLGENWEKDRALIARLESATPWVVTGPFSNDTLEKLLASGRLPARGAAEVLAGPLAELDTFELGGTTFTVVGRFSPRVAAFIQAYVLPADAAHAALFNEEAGANSGYVLPDARGYMVQLREKARARLEEAEANTAVVASGMPGVMEMLAMPGRDLALLGVLALALVALGAAWAFTHTLEWLAARSVNGGAMAVALHAPGRRRRLWVSLHLVLYGAFFLSMLAALVWPGANAALKSWVGAVFSEGGLSYVGRAYASGNILQAAVATFYHNFVTATLVWNVAVSLVVPFLGLFKTAGSLALVGFAMAPIWSDTFAGYTYHSITMGLEIEAYILATFSIVVYALHFFRGVVRGAFLREMVQGLQTVYGCVLIAAVLLGAAALFEAVTLILFA